MAKLNAIKLTWLQKGSLKLKALTSIRCTHLLLVIPQFRLYMCKWLAHPPDRCKIGLLEWRPEEGDIYEDSPRCYELKSLGLDKRTTLVLSNTRELNRDPFTK